MIHMLTSGDEEVLHVLEGPEVELRALLLEWLTGLCGPEPKPRLPTVWDMPVAERKDFWSSQKRWQESLEDYSTIDFVEWLEGHGFREQKFRTCDVHPLGGE